MASKPNKPNGTLRFILWLLLLLISTLFSITTLILTLTDPHKIIGVLFLILSVALLVMSSVFLHRVGKEIFFSKKHIAKRQIAKKKKAYKEIEKIHKYCQEGIITQEEYESLRADILQQADM